MFKPVSLLAIVFLFQTTIPMCISSADDIRSVRAMKSELKKLKQRITQMSQANDTSPDSLRGLVKQAFDLQMELQKERIERAEADLAKIKSQYQERLLAADQIIASRMTELAQAGVPETDVQKIDVQKIDVPATVLAAEGWQAWMRREYRAALPKFQAAVKQDPKLLHALNGLGWTHFHLQDRAKAIEVFKEVLMLDPTYAGATNGLGQAMMAEGNLAGAEAVLTKATEFTIKEHGEAQAIAKGVTASWFGLVETLMRAKKYDEAITWTERYLKHDADNDRMKQNLKAAKQSRS